MGEGLIGGGPPDPETGEQPFMQPPSHEKGLNTACEALRENGTGVVDIFGPPPTPGSGCPHGQ